MNQSPRNKNRFKTTLIVFLFLYAAPSYSSDAVDNICNAGGYYSGAEDRFLSGLATHILAKKGIMNNSKCTALWQYAYNVGAYFSRNGKFKNPSDSDVALSASKFATKAYDSILKDMDLK